MCCSRFTQAPTDRLYLTSISTSIPLRSTMVEADRDSGNFRISSHLACHHVRSSGRVKRGIRNVGHATLLAVLLLAAPLCAVAFVSNSGSLGYTSNAASPSASRPINPTFLPPSSVNIPSRAASSSSQTKLNMFMGSDGGILGIGTPELVRTEVSSHYRTLTSLSTQYPAD